MGEEELHLMKLHEMKEQGIFGVLSQERCQGDFVHLAWELLTRH